MNATIIHTVKIIVERVVIPNWTAPRIERVETIAVARYASEDTRQDCSKALSAATRLAESVGRLNVAV